MEAPIKSILNELSGSRCVQVVVKGNSMSPRIENGETIMISPLFDRQLETGDIVLVRIGYYKFITHQILEIKGDRYVIGNQARKIDGIVTLDAIYGIVIRINHDIVFDGLTVAE